MEDSIFELAVNELLERQALVKAELRKRFKGVKPFRMEKVTDEELIMNYQQILDNPDIEAQLRAEMGDEPIDKLHTDMHELINRRLRNA